MASTDIEVYRPFTGRRGAPRRAWLALALSGVRAGLSGKLALLLLYVPPAIATVVFGFVVYAKFALQAGLAPAGVGDGGALVNALGSRASQMIEVRQMIVMFNLAMRTFALLSVGWYGAGLLAEDRRQGAHLLYFARPIRRSDYLFGKLLTVSVFASFTALVPVLVICAVATFTSPDWSFVREEGMVIVNSALYSLIWITVTGTLVIAVSSACERKSFALIAFFGLFMLSQAVSIVLAVLQEDERWLALSLMGNLHRVGQDLLGWQAGAAMAWPAAWSWAILAGTTLASLAFASARVRRLEVVA